MLRDSLITQDSKLCAVDANTDGIVYKIPKSKFDELDAIVKAWEKRSRMTMEYDYTKYIAQKDVNNYIAVFDNGKIERKGGAVKESNPLDYDLPVVKDAITEYFVNGVKPEDYINRIDMIKPFMKTYKISSKYSHALYGDDEVSGKVFRVFASRSRFDKCLYKQKNGKNKEKFAGCPERCKIVNDDVNNMKVPKWLDKFFYINMAYKYIKMFEGK